MTEFNTETTYLYNPNAKKKPTTVSNNKVQKNITNKNTNNNNNSGKKIDPNDELPKLTTVGREIGMKIQQARIAKGWKQKMVSDKMNMDTSLYQKYENGTALRNGQILNKLGKILGVKFTGKNV